MNNNGKYRDNDLLELSKFSYDQLQDLYMQFIDHFKDEKEFDEFVTMQNRYYPKGVRYTQFVDNIGNYSVLNVMNSLRKKLGQDAIKEHMTDDGTIFYSLGRAPNLNE